MFVLRGTDTSQSEGWPGAQRHLPWLGPLAAILVQPGQKLSCPAWVQTRWIWLSKWQANSVLWTKICECWFWSPGIRQIQLLPGLCSAPTLLLSLPFGSRALALAWESSTLPPVNAYHFNHCDCTVTDVMRNNCFAAKRHARGRHCSGQPGVGGLR